MRFKRGSVHLRAGDAFFLDSQLGLSEGTKKGVGVALETLHEDVSAGDILLLLGARERLDDVTGRLGLLPLADRGHSVVQRDKVWEAVGIFAAAIAAASFGWVYLPVALGCVAALYVLLNIVPLRDVYASVEWPVIVLLGSMIPIGGALQSTGGTALIAQGILTLTQGLPAAAVLVLLMVVTMTLSDFLNNVATTLIAAPIALTMATATATNPDAWLMAVAVAASGVWAIARWGSWPREALARGGECCPPRLPDTSASPECPCGSFPSCRARSCC